MRNIFFSLVKFVAALVFLFWAFMALIELTLKLVATLLPIAVVSGIAYFIYTRVQAWNREKEVLFPNEV